MSRIADLLGSVAGGAGSAAASFGSSLFGIDFATISSVLKDMYNVPGAMNALEKESSQINENFILGRARILEFKSTIATVSPIVRELGGDVKDVVDMIQDSSAALSRVVVFNKEVYTDMFLLTKLLDEDTKTIVTNFSNVGISIANVKGDVEKSIQYIKNIGMDAKSVMSSVVSNADLLNRFNFKEGVVGFSKMAATVAMLKADMLDVKSFADKVFNVEGAIETSSALQRLGIFMGDLADPFALMNKSLNDPEGLIMSVAKAVEQFTTLDTETGNISINPSAMGMFKELETSLSIDGEKLKKMAINMREFNERASQIDFKFNLSEEQEMLIANLAYLDNKGDYVVTIKDEQTGEMIAKKVSELTETQVSKLKDLSKEKPEELIDIAKESMSTGNLILNNLIAIKYRLLFGAAGTPKLLDFQEGNREWVKDKVLTELDNLFSQDDLLKLRTKLGQLNLDPTNPMDAIKKIFNMGEITNFTTKLDVITKKLKDAAVAAGLPISNQSTEGGSGTTSSSSTDGAGSFKYDRISPFNQNMPGPKPLDNGMFYNLNDIFPKNSNYETLVKVDVVHTIRDKNGITRPMTEQEMAENQVKLTKIVQQTGIRRLDKTT